MLVIPSLADSDISIYRPQNTWSFHWWPWWENWLEDNKNSSRSSRIKTKRSTTIKLRDPKWLEVSSVNLII